jgi:hypothetical protein
VRDEKSPCLKCCKSLQDDVEIGSKHRGDIGDGGRHLVLTPTNEHGRKHPPLGAVFGGYQSGGRGHGRITRRRGFLLVRGELQSHGFYRGSKLEGPDR